MRSRMAVLEQAVLEEQKKLVVLAEVEEVGERHNKLAEVALALVAEKDMSKQVVVVELRTDKVVLRMG